MRKSKSPWLGFVLGCLLLLVGGSVSWHGFGLVDRAQRSVEWPQAEGKVLSSQVCSKREKKGKVMHWAEVNYEFTVKGEKRLGSTISFGSYRSSSAGEFRAIVDKYPVGKAVSVYYDANDPGSNVLEPGITMAVRVPQIIGLVLLGVGLLMTAWPVVAWAVYRPEPPEVMTIE